eukprot:1155365-Pelagomonas_calceolata.AAC.12
MFVYCNIIAKERDSKAPFTPVSNTSCLQSEGGSCGTAVPVSIAGVFFDVNYWVHIASQAYFTIVKSAQQGIKRIR